MRPAFTLCYAAPETLQACMAPGPEPQAEDGKIQQQLNQSAGANSLQSSSGTDGCGAHQIVAAAGDVWALGVVAVELLTDMRSLLRLSGEREAVEAALGRRAYPWEGDVGVFDGARIEVLPGLPAEAVRGLLRGCLSRKAGARPTTAAVFEALSQCAA